MTHIGKLSGVPWWGLLAGGIAVLALSAGLAREAGAATRFVAATGNDAGNTCLASGSPCKTITRALTQAVTGDTISVAAGTYNLALGETFPLTINKTLTLTGAGAGSTILDAIGANQRVITINSGTVTIAGVTITGGRVSCTGSLGFPCGANGGGLVNSGTLTLTNSTVSGNTASCTGECDAEGGGLENFGTLTLTNSTVSGNAATCSGFDCDKRGGGLGNAGTMTLTNSTVSGNTARRGGGLFNFTFTTTTPFLTLTNSTVSGNVASLGGGLENFGTLALTNSTVSGNTASLGGGLINDGNGILTLTNVTMSGNTASCTSGCGSGPGGGLANGSFIAPPTLMNTIIANNTGGNCSVPLAPGGHNLDSGNTCGFTGPGDLRNIDPLLGPLANNGGPTQTHALLPGSPAIDAGSPDCPPPATDQRGVSRPQGAACDIGAFEFGPVEVAAQAFVTRLYQTVLGRAPDPGGLAAFIAQIQQFGTVIPTVLAFFKSQEFLSHQLTDEQFLTVLYHTFLNRDPDPDGLAAFLALLQTGCRTRDTLIAALSFSDEFRSLVPPVPVADPRIPFLAEVFAWTLNRPPDPGGFQSFLTQLQRSTAVSTITQFLHSFEFTNPRRSANDYVSALYLVFLGRPPDCGGLASFVAALTPDTDPKRDQLAASFAGSGEFQTILARVFP
jgi:hypothetical protein